MLVKELSARSGVKKKTIDSYLGTRCYMPSAEAAVHIAQALGVSVEYLVTGKIGSQDRPLSSFSPDIQALVRATERLCEKDRHIMLTIADCLRNR
ncbi:MAG: helix-turn-helix domain-containing protein [Treponema sp.]|nr:helix-turn-helix domain-containing protein [Treponema sp.]